MAIDTGTPGFSSSTSILSMASKGVFGALSALRRAFSTFMSSKKLAPSPAPAIAPENSFGTAGPLLTNDSVQTADPLDRVLAGNKNYKQKTTSSDPQFFPTLAKGQAPEILWIGCADSRVPETTVCDCKPGDLFVHRNVANILHADDINSLSVIDYAVGVLKVKKIMVCGHTKCGGAIASLSDNDLGETLNKWVAPLRAIRKEHQAELDALEDEDARAVLLAELNVKACLETLKKNSTVISAMEERGLTLHGAIYDLGEGELRML